MSHEDINEASDDSRIQSGGDSGTDGQDAKIGGSENHDVSRTKAWNLTGDSIRKAMDRR